MSNRTNGLYEFGSFRLDAAKRLLTRAGESVALAPRTFDLLLVLAESQGRALTKAELMQSLWPETFVEEANLSFQMSALRKALGEEGTEWIETVPKHGYRFTAAVTKVAADVAEADAPESTSPPPAPHPPRSLLPWAVAAAAAVFALIISVVHFRERPPVERPVRFSILPPDHGGSVDLPVLSPDGERLAFIGVAPDGSARLWVRRLDSATAEPLAAAAAQGRPFWSPDSRSIAFFDYTKLMKIDLRGGSPQTICDAPGGISDGDWSSEGVILFRGGLRRELYRVAATGGEAQPATVLNSSRQESTHSSPQFLPDGRHFLYFVQSARAENRGIYVGSLDSRESRRLLNTERDAAYAGSPSGAGHLLFLRGTTLMAQPFDAHRLSLTGEPSPVAEEVWASPSYLLSASFSVSGNGVLAYRTGSDAMTELAWFDRRGRRLGTVAEPAVYNNPALSPDETKIIVARRKPQDGWTSDLWLYDLAQKTSSRFTFDPGHETNAAWSPDGSRIAFNSTAKGSWDIYQKAVTGTGEAQLLLESSENKFLQDWSPDGRLLLFSVSSGTAFLGWTLPLGGDHKPTGPLPIDDHPEISPNGRWVAYDSKESDRFEVFVQSFPPSGGKWQVSADGGLEPHWSRDGKELFYRAPNKLMAIQVQTDSQTFQAGAPRPVFDVRWGPWGRNSYQVASNGQRFLMNLPVENASPSSIMVVVNWTAGLKR